MDSGTGTGTPGCACACLMTGFCVGDGVACTVADGAGGAAAEAAFGAGFDGVETALAGCDCADESETTLFELPQAENAKSKAAMKTKPNVRRKLR
ncbi:MAG: hypothetical protein JMDDDDMK_00895 [Acidobacteria bacterium]|nr:hypothetical protein [Acidobacteriota bacterium]